MTVLPQPSADPQNSTSDARTEYVARLNARCALLSVRRQQHRALGNARLWLFLVAVAMAFAALGPRAFSMWWLTIPATVSVVIGAKMQRLESQSMKLARATAFYQRALARLDGHWAGMGEAGVRF